MQQASEPATVAAVRTLLAERKAAVEGYLQRYFAAKLQEAAEVAPESYSLLDAVRVFTLAGGKRIRAALVAAGYRCFAPEPDDDRLLAAGAAVEVLHAFLLAHDDVFDRDATRHGQPTLHQFFRDDIAVRYPTADAPRYGTSLAILAGDVAAMLAYDVLTQAPVAPERLIQATRVLARVALETGYGEALDVVAELEPQVDEARVLLIHRYKTAKYSIEGPLHIGALLAGADATQLRALSEFAVPLGIAYQLRDDTLGVFGSEQLTGKAVGADLREGKRTLLSVHGLRGPHCAELRTLIGNPQLDAAGVVRAQRLLRDGGSLAFSEARSADLQDRAAAALQHTDIRDDARCFLDGLTRVLMQRSD
ncbi:MAG TPA: polyprenyl synthetase family protein [Chloroflexota bacterium]|jgi:geranylgeranyl diphosphate synthase type I|nr:polyprenyl synthetase family protein [Chloroflexota bacterium]